MNIDANLLLYVFLPALIFGEAMSLNWYHLKGAFVQSVILAGPGVLIGAALMGCLAKGILPYNWSWNLAMVFGSILSATDPVAVVSLLKTVGASPKLTILIVGESLLNDGSAMVLFTIFYNALNGREYTASVITGFTFAAAIGSVFMGVIFGLITVRWLRTASRPLKEIDVTMQIAMTVCCAYLSFFVAQFCFGISGVLACCGAGGVVAWLGPPIILKHESMHNVWGMIEWALNTLVFLLAGLIIGHRVLQKVNVQDWFIMIFFYLMLMVIRVITIFMLYPFICRIGHKCTFEEAIFMSWAGLRGALGMALALLVKNTAPNDIDDETSRMFFFVGGVATLTLLINATTAKMVLVRLGLLTTNTAEKMIVTTQIKKKLQKQLQEVVDEMTEEFSFSEKDLIEVKLSCRLLRELEHGETRTISQDPEKQRRYAELLGIQSMTTSNTIRIQRMNELLSSRSKSSNAIVLGELLVFIRTIFLEIVRVQYWHFIEIGKLPRQSFSAQFLLYSIDVGLDEVNAQALTHGSKVNHAINHTFDWHCIEKELDYRLPGIPVLTFLNKTFSSSKACHTTTAHFLSFLETRKEKRDVYMLTSFIEAHEHAQAKIHDFLGLDGNVLHKTVVPQTPEEAKVISESKLAVEEAKQRLQHMDLETVSAIRSKQAARMVLSKEAEMVKNLVNEGLLTPKYAQEFFEEISEDTSQIEKERNMMYREHTLKRTAAKTGVAYDDSESVSRKSTGNSVFGGGNNNGKGVSMKTNLNEPLL